MYEVREASWQIRMGTRIKFSQKEFLHEGEQCLLKNQPLGWSRSPVTHQRKGREWKNHEGEWRSTHIRFTALFVIRKEIQNY